MACPARIAPLLALLAIAVAGCGGSDGGAAGTGEPGTVAANGVGVLTIGDRTITLDRADCAETPDELIAAGSAGDDDVLVRRSADSSAITADAAPPGGSRSEFLQAPAATVRFTPPQVVAEGEARTLSGDGAPFPISVTLTCPEDRGAGSGELTLGDTTVTLDRVECTGSATEGFNIRAYGTVAGGPLRVSLTRMPDDANPGGWNDSIAVADAFDGVARAGFAGSGDLLAGPGLFALVGDLVSDAGTDLTAVPAGGGAAVPATFTMRCGLNTIR